MKTLVLFEGKIVERRSCSDNSSKHRLRQGVTHLGIYLSEGDMLISSQYYSVPSKIMFMQGTLFIWSYIVGYPKGTRTWTAGMEIRCITYLTTLTPLGLLITGMALAHIQKLF